MGKHIFIRLDKEKKNTWNHIRYQTDLLMMPFQNLNNARKIEQPKPKKTYCYAFQKYSSILNAFTRRAFRWNILSWLLLLSQLTGNDAFSALPYYKVLIRDEIQSKLRDLKWSKNMLLFFGCCCCCCCLRLLLPFVCKVVSFFNPVFQSWFTVSMGIIRFGFGFACGFLISFL